MMADLNNRNMLWRIKTDILDLCGCDWSHN